MRELPEVAITIPAHNSSRTIGKALDACLAQDYPREKLRITVVDDGSTDNTKEIVESYDGVNYIFQKNAGPARARNAGWKSVTSEIVAFLDADCVPERKWISKMAAHYESDNAVCVGGRYGITNEGNFLAELIYAEFLARYERCSKSTKFIGSYGYSFRRSLLEEIGGYDEDYKMASAEDNDLAYRLLAHNCSLIFDRDIVIKHHFPTGLRGYLRVQFWHGYWRMKLYRDHARMMKGDEYSNIVDFAQPPLILISICLLPLLFVRPVIMAETIVLGIVFFLQIPMGLRIFANTRRVKYFVAYIGLGLIRALARGFGMVVGILKFWKLRKK
jgi:cellulose synthase/poly-beta-1,6-N-acetylglucosamine synthase-like glycosyltransferase